ncbi:helix-turn-helix domain-containing protein [Puia dinghuensis]|uniref:HTH araC/xylS-type domain-containing protein n=1 Tax=Puia dinghuensis TaxID=1792502 RepID=A0A8J2UGB3_9BACT|nr:helix-turn-helix transcriptional regulator [Puia dinghuensis]GGB12933.1 hypothetical protein GCM10011511_40730 [Puia dinghuensis]
MLLKRSAEIFNNYLAVIDEHLEDILTGNADEMFELRDIAKRLFIHPTHLSNVIKEYTGKHPCYFYEQKILAVAKRLLADSSQSIAAVARRLTYDPSNFTKWFRTYAGVSPSEYRRMPLTDAGYAAAPYQAAG